MVGKTIWAVSSGSYSDYGIHALYSTEEQAERVASYKNKAENWHDYFVESFDLDPNEGDPDKDDELPEVAEFWQFRAGANGFIPDAHPFRTWRKLDEPDIIEDAASVGQGLMSLFGGYSGTTWRIYVSADHDLERAMKIAWDRFAQYQAEQAGIA